MTIGNVSNYFAMNQKTIIGKQKENESGFADSLTMNLNQPEEETTKQTMLQTEEEQEESTADTASKMMKQFYNFIQDKIENSDTKYQIGGTEMTNEEWQKLIANVDNAIEDQSEDQAADETTIKKEENEIEVKRTKSMNAYEELHNTTKKAPYSELAKDGIIEYNGVVYVCDDEHQSINLGDVSNSADVIRIPLSGGGTLNVNRDNIGSLAKSIGMFSPEDVNLIMRALTLDAKVQRTKKEIDDMTNGIGNGNTNMENTETVDE